MFCREAKVKAQWAHCRAERGHGSWLSDLMPQTTWANRVSEHMPEIHTGLNFLWLMMSGNAELRVAAGATREATAEVLY